MEFFTLPLKMLATLTVAFLMFHTISCIEIKEASPERTEVLTAAPKTKESDLEPENSHGYGYYGPGIGLGYGYQVGYPGKQPYYPGYHSGYTNKPAVGLGGYYNPAFGYSYGLGSGFGAGYPGAGYHGYNPAPFTHHHAGVAPHGYPFFG